MWGTSGSAPIRRKSVQPNRKGRRRFRIPDYSRARDMSFSLIIASFADFNGLRLQAVRSIRGSYLAELSDDRQVIRSAKFSDLDAAQKWLVACARSLTADDSTPVHWKKASAPVFAIVALFLASFLVLYGVPTLAEIMTFAPVGPLAFILIGDFASYVVLFFLGYKWTAALAYVGARVIELLLVQTGIVPLNSMLWVTDAIPSLLCSAILCNKFFFWPRQLS
jgi:hypothetical protein